MIIEKPLSAEVIERREAIAHVLVMEHRYVVERLQAGTMDSGEARAWLRAHGHDEPTQ